jgi:hypothetical protein
MFRKKIVLLPFIRNLFLKRLFNIDGNWLEGLEKL